jgi:hypothetical protein
MRRLGVGTAFDSDARHVLAAADSSSAGFPELRGRAEGGSRVLSIRAAHLRQFLLHAAGDVVRLWANGGIVNEWVS